MVCRRAFFDARRVIESPEHREMVDIVRRDPCSYCGAHDDFWRDGIGADHVIPRIADGPLDPMNVTGCCRACNSAKRDRPLLVFLFERVAA